jgi:hypothetical protein
VDRLNRVLDGAQPGGFVVQGRLEDRVELVMVLVTLAASAR